MPNQHENSRVMRVQRDTVEKVAAIADAEGKAWNAMLARIVDEWMVENNWSVSSRVGIVPARTDTPAPRRPVGT